MSRQQESGRSGSMDVALVEIIVEFTKAHIKAGSFR